MLKSTIQQPPPPLTSFGDYIMVLQKSRKYQPHMLNKQQKVDVETEK